MLFLLIIALCIGGFVLHLNKHHKFKTIAFVIAVTLAQAIGSGIVPTWLIKNLQMRDQIFSGSWKNNNAIVILGGGTAKWPENGAITSSILSYSRIFRAAELYFLCKKNKAPQCTIIATGGDPLKNGIAESQIIQRELTSIGVFEADIKIETKSLNTYQNAEFTGSILQKNLYDNIVIVTSGIHTKRALLYFSKFTNNLCVAPSDYAEPRLTLLPLAYNFALADFAMHEYIGIAKFYVYNLLGWNTQSSKPGDP